MNKEYISNWEEILAPIKKNRRYLWQILIEARLFKINESIYFISLNHFNELNIFKIYQNKKDIEVYLSIIFNKEIYLYLDLEEIFKDNGNINL